MSLEILLVRHGQSTANVAAARAESSGAELIEVDARDADITLSETGLDQARALGSWLRSLPDDARPDLVWSSPYRRALDTARTALAEAGIDVPVRTDERLRDRDLGITDMHTQAGIRARYPEEAERREWLGKFYHRPPGGESWADVALRVRSVLADLERLGEGRVLVSAHDVVIMIFRYVCEGLDEETVLDVARTDGVRNASVTRIAQDGPASWRLVDYNIDTHLTDRGVPPTDEPAVGEQESADEDAAP